MYPMVNGIPVIKEMFELTGGDINKTLPISSLKSLQTLDAESIAELLSVLEVNKFIELKDGAIDFGESRVGRKRNYAGMGMGLVQPNSNFSITDKLIEQVKNS